MSDKPIPIPVGAGSTEEAGGLPKPPDDKEKKKE